MNAELIVPWTTVFLSLIGFLAVTRLRRGPTVAPMAMTLLMLLAIFGIRPIMMVENDTYWFYGGNDVRAGYVIASWVGLLSVVFLLLGYVLGAATRRQSATTDLPNWRASRVSLKHAALVSAGLLAAWLLIMVVVGGGISYIALLFEGRSDATEARLAGVPAIVPALPVAAALFVAMTRMQIERVARLPGVDRLIYWTIVALAVVPPSALGSRRFLLPSVIAGLLGALPPVWNRIISIRMVVLTAVGFVVLTIFPFVRSSGSRGESSDLVGAIGEYFGSQGLGGTLENFFLSYDTEMFNYVAYLATRLGSSIEYGWGRGTLGDLLLSPIPASISPAPLWSNQILIQAFGGPCGISYCPVPSVSGVFFYDGGLPAVVAGMMVLGFVLSRFEVAFLKAEGAKLIVLLTLGAFTIQAVRGSTVSQLWIAAQIVAVLIVLEWIAYRTGATNQAARQSRNGARRRPSLGWTREPAGRTQTPSTASPQ